MGVNEVEGPAVRLSDGANPLQQSAGYPRLP